MGKVNGNADNDTTETLNIAEAEEMNGKDITKPHIDKKGKSSNFLHEHRCVHNIERNDSLSFFLLCNIDKNIIRY